MIVYGGYVTAKKVTENCLLTTAIAPFVIRAENEDHARGKARRLSLARYPQSEGWVDHDYDVCQDSVTAAETVALTAEGH